MKSISSLNDRFRKSILSPGRNKLVLTPGVSALAFLDQMTLLHRIMNFSDFNENNDPHGEHDFGDVKQKGVKYFFKIDYFDKSMKHASKNPHDPDITVRIMTVMRADEY